MADITTPADFNFSGRYYAQILESLVEWLRENVPEITTDNPVEPAIQLLRAFALTGHLNNVLLDMQARESILATARLRDTVVAHLALIDYTVAGDIPASAIVVMRLSRTFTTSQDIISDNALLTTKRVNNADPVFFEADAAVSVNRTDRPTAVYVYDESADAYTDVTTQANTDASTFSALPATVEPGDCLYILHTTAMSDKIDLTGVATPGVGYVAVWEAYKDDLDDDAPDSVAVVGTQLKMYVDGLLGTAASREGLEVTAQLNSSGATATATVQHDGNNYILISGFLGQTTPSTTASDYTVGSNWYEIPGLSDSTDTGVPLAVDGAIDFPLPKTETLDWNKVSIQSLTAYAVRLRVISVSTPTTPVIDRVEWDGNRLYVETPVTQGRTRSEASLGTSDGTANQQFTLGASPVIPGSVLVNVGTDAWQVVDDFLVSTGSDKHVLVDIDSDGAAVITFGDGDSGKIPASGANIAAQYRTDADVDGNVGAETIVRSSSGISFVRSIYNPRPASGWAGRRGTTTADLERLKVEGPASLRDLNRVVNGDDAANIAVRWVAEDGSSPIARAFAIEGGSGPKTITLYVISPTGGLVDVAYRTELETLFNGDATLGTQGITIANQRVYVRDPTLVPIDVTATVVGGNQESAETALEGLLNPLAVEADGFTYVWKPDQDVPDGRIETALWQSGTGVTNVILTLPAGSTPIGVDELPTVGTLSITAA